MTPIEQLKARLQDPVLRQLTALTDRSRTITGDRCPRNRWLTYEYQGLGVTPERTPLYFIFGDAIHRWIDGFLEPLRDRDEFPDRDQARKAIDNATAHFKARLSTELPVEMEMRVEDSDRLANDMAMTEFSYEDEQAALLEGLLWAWYFRRLPRFAETYRVLEIEEEDAIKLGEYPRFTPLSESSTDEGQDVEVWFQARADALLEERTTSGLYILSIKSAGQWEARKNRSGNTDMQGISESYCVEQRVDRQIMGIQMEYLIKGRRDNKGGFWETYSPVVRGWMDKADSPGEDVGRYWRYEWQDEWGNRRRLSQKQKPYRPWFSLEMGVENWVELLAGGLVQPEAGDALAEVLVSPEYFRQDRQMRSWFIGTSQREVERKKNAERLNGILSDPTTQDQLDRDFPQYTHSCEYPTQCPNKPLCFGTQPPAEVDPLSFQDEENVVKYDWRTPHHLPEKLLVQIEGT